MWHNPNISKISNRTRWDKRYRSVLKQRDCSKYKMNLKSPLNFLQSVKTHDFGDCCCLTFTVLDYLFIYTENCI